MNLSKRGIFLQVLVIMMAFFVPANGQTDKQLLAQLVAQDEEAINALVLYPEETRTSILEATQYPEALIKLESIQSQTSEAFRKLIEAYPRSTQQMIWDLTRYPQLIERLVETRKAGGADLNTILKGYPEVIHARARKALRSHLSELMKVNELNQSAESAFESLLVHYPSSTKESLRNLVALPEVLTILTDNIRLTVLVGDLYNKEPDWVLRQVDSLNLVVARENAEELEGWKNSLENDPLAAEELEASAESFQDAYGYDDLYYDSEENDDLYYEDNPRTEQIVHEYYHYHFPYWFSYPYWYQYPRWRLYPYWYDWGFFFGPRRTIVVINLPSLYFTNWYFYHPHHHYRWSYLSAHFTRHYYRYRRIGSPITTGVTVWRNRNRDIVSDRWLNDDDRLSQRFREFGKFEADRARYNRHHPQQELGQKEFRERSPQRYRTLSGAVTGRERTQNQRTVQPRERRKPTSDPQDRTRARPDIDTKNQSKVPSIVPRVQKGTERHRSISERSKTSRARTLRSPTPQTKAPKRSSSRARTIPSTKKKTTTGRRKN